MPYFRALCYFTQAAGADHEFSCSSVPFHKDAELVIAFKIIDHLYDWTIAGIGTVIEDGAAAVPGISFKQIWIGKTTDFSGIMARSPCVPWMLCRAKKWYLHEKLEKSYSNFLKLRVDNPKRNSYN